VKLELLQDAAEFWPRAEADILAARRRVHVQALTFEGDAAGRRVAAALAASPAPDRRVLVDSFTKHVVSDRVVWLPGSLLDRELRAEVRETKAMQRGLGHAGVSWRFVGPLGRLLRSAPARNHKKLVLVDDGVAYIGGINFSDHNFAWRDLMLRIEGRDAVSFLAEDFVRTWEGRPAPSSSRFPGLELHCLDGRGNEARFEETVLSAVDAARRRIYLECAYLTSPFLERLSAAGRRGVRVTVVTPEANNWGLARDLLRWPRITAGLQVRLYRGRMTHMKALLADDDVLVLGSANFDLWSYHFQGEYLARITEPSVIHDFEARVAAEGLRGSQPVDGPPRPLRGRLARLAIRELESLTLRLSGARPAAGASAATRGTKDVCSAPSPRAGRGCGPSFPRPSSPRAGPPASAVEGPSWPSSATA
jgi:cardiolipin synthase